MNWQIEKGVRCDLVCYAARNLSGKMSPVRIFPGGNRKGDVQPGDLRSMVVRAPFGTRVILVTEPGPDWESHPWRCIRMREGTALLAAGVGMPGVRLPDLNLLDKHGAKRTDHELESTYPRAERLDEGEGWTFGCIGTLQGKVQLIRVEKDRVRSTDELAEPDQLARALVDRLVARGGIERDALIDDVAASLQVVLVDGGHEDATARVREFRAWAAEN